MKDKWKTLSHNGPYFPKEYEYKKYKVKVSKKEFVFNKEAEEMLYAWTQKSETKYVKDKVFQKNFYKDLIKKIDKSLLSEIKGAKFPEDWGFSDIWLDIQAKKDARKNRSKEEKAKDESERQERKKIYGYAMLDGKRVEIGNYTVEPPGIFMGRGKHPLRGRWKRRISPSDVTINISKGSKIPNPPNGSKWKAVIENKKSLWLAMWHNELTNTQKRILFSTSSFIRQKNDIKKFDKAIQLANNLTKVREFINKKLTSRDYLTREIATVCHLIDKIYIRIGDEKSKDEADTVGASTLRVEHVSINGTSVTFDFLGKDSIKFHKKVDDLNINAIRNLKEFIKGKAKKDLIFNHIKSSDVNNFLGLIMPGLTAKQFRTAAGSIILSNLLKNKKIDKNLKVNKKLESFIDANIEVALKLNHQNTVSDAYKKSLENMRIKLKNMRKELKTLKKEAEIEIKKAEDAKKAKLSYIKNRYKGEKLKTASSRVRKTFKNKKERIKKRIEKKKERIENLKTKIKIKEKSMGVALGTSKLNYCDPRIPISWCKDNNIDVKKIYPLTAQKKFEWALNIKKDFYKKYPKV